MPRFPLQHNPASVCELCRLSPETRFVFMHICHPCDEEMSEVVEEEWCSLGDALGLIDPIMRADARRVFDLKEKERLLRAVPWKKSDALVEPRRATFLSAGRQ
jgi:hypothetical protein